MYFVVKLFITLNSFLLWEWVLVNLSDNLLAIYGNNL